jgi:hypothetical protein
MKNGKTVAWFGSNKNGAAGLFILGPKGSTPGKPEELPSDIASMLTSMTKSGGATLLAEGGSVDFFLNDRPDKNGKADSVSLSANARLGHKSGLALTGRDGMFASLDVFRAPTTLEIQLDLAMRRCWT